MLFSCSLACGSIDSGGRKLTILSSISYIRFEGKTTLSYQLEDRLTVSTWSADGKLCASVPLSAVSDSSIAVEISRFPLPPRCQYSAPHHLRYRVSGFLSFPGMPYSFPTRNLYNGTMFRLKRRARKAQKQDR